MITGLINNILPTIYVQNVLSVAERQSNVEYHQHIPGQLYYACRKFDK